MPSSFRHRFKVQNVNNGSAAKTLYRVASLCFSICLQCDTTDKENQVKKTEKHIRDLSAVVHNSTVPDPQFQCPRLCGLFSVSHQVMKSQDTRKSQTMESFFLIIIMTPGSLFWGDDVWWVLAEIYSSHVQPVVSSNFDALWWVFNQLVTTLQLLRGACQPLITSVYSSFHTWFFLVNM